MYNKSQAEYVNEKENEGQAQLSLFAQHANSLFLTTWATAWPFVHYLNASKGILETPSGTQSIFIYATVFKLQTWIPITRRVVKQEL